MMNSNLTMENYLQQIRLQNVTDSKMQSVSKIQQNQYMEQKEEKKCTNPDKINIIAVSTAALAVVTAGVCLYKLNNNKKLLNTLQQTAQNTQNTLQKTQGDLTTIQNKLQNTETTLQNTQNTLQNTQNKLTGAQNTINTMLKTRQQMVDNLLFPNGVENIDFIQSNIGDCYLLSSLYGLSRNKKGQEIIKKMVTIDDGGNFIVKFKNLKPITVTPAELKGQGVKVTSNGGTKSQIRKAVYGDMGVQAIERAYGKYRKQLQMQNQLNNLFRRSSLYAIDGGRPSDALKIMSGFNCTDKGDTLKGNFKKQNINVGRILDNLADNFDKHVVCVATPMSNFAKITKNVASETYGWMDTQKKFPCRHAYTVSAIDKAKQTVTIVNPHDTKKPVTISYNVFEQTFGEIFAADA